ncbi:MAG: hypothetical protein Harvfovirus4_51 [Harvfovirus sp.]|uniref:Uncharacterized protein n=1 Tax=Harvfovirus sp. TaxID=2487768 RepID=A0A3G5A0H4_9VIRU|nr:MAG: hypothetical protein Harvfovirus4_51 [Harvfovirus sp.]
MTSQFYHNKYAIDLNDLILDELHSAIRNFLEASLNIFGSSTKEKLNFKCHLFNLNQGDIEGFHTMKGNENGFSQLFAKGIELFDILLSVNIVDQNYSSHIKLVVILDHMRRLIYEANCSSEKVMKVPRPLPVTFSEKGCYDALDQYGKFPGIINLLKRFNWVTVSTINHDETISFHVKENLNEYIPGSRLSNEKYDSLREDFVIALRVLLKKLTELYNTSTKIQRLVTEICHYDDRILAKLVEIDNNNPQFILWKNHLGFVMDPKSEEKSYKKLTTLQTNYENFVSNYGGLLGGRVTEKKELNKSKRQRSTKSSKSSKKNKSIYEGMV